MDISNRKHCQDTKNKYCIIDSKKMFSMAVFAALTAFSGGGSVSAADSMPVFVPGGTSRDSIDLTSTSGSIKSGVNVQGNVNTVNASFTSSTLNVLNSDDYGYSAILTEANGVINNLNATISGTNITVNGDKAISGALIKSMNKITAINADISGNTLTNSNSVTGGLVAVESIGEIGSITGAGFRNNTVTVSADAGVTGGVLYNWGTLGSISNTAFSSNTVTAQNGNVNGGAVANVNNLTGDISNVSFTDNKISTQSGNANGGALYNTGIIGGKIINATFTGNTATAANGVAHGGAIYTTTDLYLQANGATSRFQGNKVVDSAGSRNEGIYVDSQIAHLTLEALNGGNLLIYDDITGLKGYNLVLNGDADGKVGLYGGVTNANLNVTGGNIDFVNSKTTDFNFGQMSSGSGAKYAIDLNVGTGESDRFAVGTGSSGIVTIDKLNILGDLPDESKLIKILSSDSSNNLNITLTQSAINAFNKDENKVVTWNDEIPTEMSFGDVLHKYDRTDTVHKRISAVASEYGGNEVPPPKNGH